MSIPEEDKLMPIYCHLSDLRRRVFFCCLFFVFSFGISYFLSDRILYFLVKPVLRFTDNKMMYTSIAEPFFVYLKIALSTAIACCVPFSALQIYLFASPGLHRHEKLWTISTASAFFLMFAIGVCVLYFLVLPQAIGFLLRFNELSYFKLDLQAKLSDYIDMVMQLIIGFGLAFETPVLLVMLSKLGIIDYRDLIRARRFAIVINFVVAAIITPPDIMSQIILGGVMTIFYEITIIICRLIAKRAEHKGKRMD